MIITIDLALAEYGHCFKHVHSCPLQHRLDSAPTLRVLDSSLKVLDIIIDDKFL